MAFKFYNDANFSIEEFIAAYHVNYDFLYYEIYTQAEDGFRFGMKCWTDNPKLAKMFTKAAKDCPISDRELESFGMVCLLFASKNNEIQ